MSPREDDRSTRIPAEHRSTRGEGELNRRRLISAGAAVAAATPLARAFGAQQGDAAAIKALEEGVALVLSTRGFDDYATLFDKDYVNWPNGGALLSRTAFLSGVKDWYDAGNYAIAARLIPISLDVFEATALFRYRMREDFNDDTTFIGDFVSTPRRLNGVWLLYRTSFWTRYRGRSEDAPPFPDSGAALTR